MGSVASVAEWPATQERGPLFASSCGFRFRNERNAVRQAIEERQMIIDLLILLKAKRVALERNAQPNRFDLVQAQAWAHNLEESP